MDSTNQSQPIIGNGTLPYDIDIAVGDLGGTSVVTISPNHSFGGQIVPRFFNFYYAFDFGFLLSICLSCSQIKSFILKKLNYMLNKIKGHV